MNKKKKFSTRAVLPQDANLMTNLNFYYYTQKNYNVNIKRGNYGKF